MAGIYIQYICKYSTGCAAAHAADAEAQNRRKNPPPCFHLSSMRFEPLMCSDSMVYWLARPLGIRTVPGSPPLVSKNSFVDKKLGSEWKTCTLKFQGNSSSYQT